MHRFFSPKVLLAATLATAALGAATVAQARPDVYLSVGFQNGPTWVEPAPMYLQPQPQPVYVQPRPVLVQPMPVYARPPIVVVPREVFERPRWAGHDARFEWERERAWRRAEWRRQRRENIRNADRYHDGDGRMHHHDYRD